MDEQNVLKIFGFNLKVARMKKNLTQADLAEKLDVHEKYISRIETGKQNVTIKTIYKIARVLEIEMHTLLQNV